jgi:hypothetical protein
MDTLKDILELLHSLYGLPGYVLVFVSCIGFGYLAKAAKFVPNDKIPLLIFLWGTIWNLLLADTREPGSSLRLWIARNLIIGFIIAGLAWLTHNRWLKLWLDPKFPSLSPATPPSDQRDAGLNQNKPNV